MKRKNQTFRDMKDVVRTFRDMERTNRTFRDMKDFVRKSRDMKKQIRTFPRTFPANFPEISGKSHGHFLDPGHFLIFSVEFPETSRKLWKRLEMSS